MMVDAPEKNKMNIPSDRYVGYKDTLTIQITDAMVRQFADLSGDNNPVHLDDNYAKNTRFGRRIAHGMILAGLISRGLTEKIGRGGIYLGQSLRFVAPVYIDDTVIIDFEIKSIREGRGIVSIQTNVKKSTGEEVLQGEATIMMAGAF